MNHPKSGLIQRNPMASTNDHIAKSGLALKYRHRSTQRSTTEMNARPEDTEGEVGVQSGRTREGKSVVAEERPRERRREFHLLVVTITTFLHQTRWLMSLALPRHMAVAEMGPLSMGREICGVDRMRAFPMRTYHMSLQEKAARRGNRCTMRTDFPRKTARED